MSDRRIPFTPEDEDRIASASLWGTIAAVTAIVSGLASAGVLVMQYLKARHLFPGVMALVPVLIQIVGLVIAVLLGAWLIQACNAFRAVARTDVADKAYLLRGFDKLHSYFLTIGVLMILGLVLGVVLVVLNLLRVSFVPF